MDKTKVQSRRWLILLLMGLAVTMTALQNTITNVGISDWQKDFASDANLAQWFSHSYILAFAGLVLLMGALGDKYGRKTLLNLGLVVFAAGSIWATAVSGSAEFIASQVLMGVGAAMIAPQTLSILADTFEKKERSMAVAVWSAFAVLGLGLGTLVGGLLLDSYSLDSIFNVSLPIVALVLIVGWFVVPNSKKTSAGSIDFVGAILSLLAVVSLVTAFLWVPEHGWTGLYTLGAFLVTIVTSAMFVVYEKGVKHPLLDVKKFKSKELLDGKLGIAIVFFNVAGLLFLMTQFLEIVQRKTMTEAGLLILPMAITMVLAAIAGQRLADKVGNKRMIANGIAITLVGMLGVGLWQTTASEWIVSITLAIVGLGAGLAMAPASNEIVKSFGDSNLGMSAATNVLVRQVFGALGIVVLGSVLNNRYASNLTAYVTGAPEEIANQITGSLHGAYDLANDFALQGQQAIANSVINTVNSAFMVGLTVAMVVAVIASLLVAMMINRKLPKN